MIRPRLLVELGTYLGVSYCAFCQAVKELGLPTQCYAIVTRRTDPTEEEAFESLKAHHDERYSLFSELLHSTFDDAAQQFDERAIDLFHIDGGRAYDAVEHDFETWLPKISDRGVVLLHNIDVDRDSFGSWQFWDEVKQRYPHFEFFHSYGLGVLAVGECVPEALHVLVASIPKRPNSGPRVFRQSGEVTWQNCRASRRSGRTYMSCWMPKPRSAKRLETVAATAGELGTDCDAGARLTPVSVSDTVVDRGAQVLGKVPLLPGIIRSTADAIIRLTRKTG